MLMPSTASSEEAYNADACDQKEIGWTPTEREFWKAACTKTFVDLKTVDGDKGTLTASFLVSILTRSPYKDKLQSRPFIVRNARINGRLDLTAQSIPTSLLAFVNCDIEGNVNLTQVRASGSVNFVGTNLDEGITIQSATIDGSLGLGPSSARRRIRVKSVIGDGARVLGGLQISHARVPEALSLISLETTFLAITSSEVASTTLANSKINGQLRLTDTVFSKPTTTDPDQEFSINLFSATVTGDVFFNRSIFQAAANFESAKIGGSVRLLGVRVHSIYARGATTWALIIGEVASRPNAPKIKTIWDQHSIFDLSYAKIGIISTPYDEHYWPEELKLTNFDVKGFDFEWYAPDREVKQRTGEWLKNWLAKQPQFSSQPYHRIESMLLDSGNGLAASAVGYARRDRERKQAWQDGEFGTAIFLTFSKCVIGYGYQSWLSIGWALGFVVLGAAVFRRTRAAKSENMPFGFAYSFDMLLPLVKLRDKHYRIEIGGLARYYFYAHKLIGWLLGFFIVAALSGISK